MDTDSPYLSRAEKERKNCIRPEMRAEWKQLRSKDCTDCFTAAAVGIFFPRMCCDKHIKPVSQEPGLFEEQFRCLRSCVFVVKLTPATTLPLTS